MIVKEMINVADTVKRIYKNEALSYIRVAVEDEHIEVKAMSIDSEFLDSWYYVKINANQVDQAIKLIKRIKFKGEHIRDLDNGIEFYVRRSPRIKMIEESIFALRSADFYSELHQEEGCVYSCILKEDSSAINDLNEFLVNYRNVECHLEDGIYMLYM